ncbi:MAG: hypothetical protein OEZ51_01485 [Nitrospinota bacterium]|nr:hypothetical protein [Nitrospinota bacterium]
MPFDLTSKSQDVAGPATEDLENLVRKSRRDILGLKIMVYTAVILLVGGYFYYNNALQITHTKFRQEISSAQSQIDTLMRDRALGAGNRLEGVMDEMVVTISRLDNEPPRTQQLIERVKEDSGEFMHTYREYSKIQSTRPLSVD